MEKQFDQILSLLSTEPGSSQQGIHFKDSSNDKQICYFINQNNGDTLICQRIQLPNNEYLSLFTAMQNPQIRRINDIYKTADLAKIFQNKQQHINQLYLIYKSSPSIELNPFIQDLVKSIATPKKKHSTFSNLNSNFDLKTKEQSTKALPQNTLSLLPLSKPQNQLVIVQQLENQQSKPNQNGQAAQQLNASLLKENQKTEVNQDQSNKEVQPQQKELELQPQQKELELQPQQKEQEVQPQKSEEEIIDVLIKQFTNEQFPKFWICPDQNQNLKLITDEGSEISLFINENISKQVSDTSESKLSQADMAKNHPLKQTKYALYADKESILIKVFMKIQTQQKQLAQTQKQREEEKDIEFKMLQAKKEELAQLLQQKEEEYQKQVSTLNLDLSKIREKIKKQNELLKQNEHQITLQRLSIEDLTLSKQEARLKQEKQFSKLEKDLQESNQSCSSQSKMIQEMNKELQNKTQTLSKNRDKIKQYEMEIQKMKQERTQLVEEMNTTKSILEKKNQKLSSQKQACLYALQRQVQLLQQESDSQIKNDIDNNLVANHQGQVQDLKDGDKLQVEKYQYQYYNTDHLNLQNKYGGQSCSYGANKYNCQNSNGSKQVQVSDQSEKNSVAQKSSSQQSQQSSQKFHQQQSESQQPQQQQSPSRKELKQDEEKKDQPYNFVWKDDYQQLMVDSIQVNL